MLQLSVLQGIQKISKRETQAQGAEVRKPEVVFLCVFVCVCVYACCILVKTFARFFLQALGQQRFVNLFPLVFPSSPSNTKTKKKGDLSPKSHGGSLFSAGWTMGQAGFWGSANVEHGFVWRWWRERWTDGQGGGSEQMQNPVLDSVKQRGKGVWKGEVPPVGDGIPSVGSHRQSPWHCSSQSP